MSARTKLNGIFLGGVAAFAAFAGAASGSWLIFLFLMLAGTSLLIHTGGVRLQHADVSNPHRLRTASWRHR